MSLIHWSELPKTPLYVLSNDKFMSGWGHAKGKINTCVVPCQDRREADFVEAYVRDRQEQHQIRIVDKIRPKSNVCYSLQYGWLRRAYEKAHIPESQWPDYVKQQ